MASIFWMPIQTRTEMLTTGFRTKLGVKVFGADLKEIEKIAVRSRTRSVIFRTPAASSPSAPPAVTSSTST